MVFDVGEKKLGLSSIFIEQRFEEEIEAISRSKSNYKNSTALLILLLILLGIILTVFFCFTFILKYQNEENDAKIEELYENCNKSKHSIDSVKK